MIYDFKSIKGGDNMKQNMKASLQKNMFNRETNFESLKSVADRFGAPSKSPPAKYTSKLRREPYEVPEQNWVLNSGLCPSQADAVRRERQFSQHRNRRMKSQISYGKILRAQQKFATLNQALSDEGFGGVFDLTENITQNLKSAVGSRQESHRSSA